AVPRPETADQGVQHLQAGRPAARRARRGRGHAGACLRQRTSHERLRSNQSRYPRGGSIGVLDDREAVMSIADIKKTAEQKMARSIEALKSELHKVRTGRAHPGILDQVHVDYYGSSVPISQVANVTLLDARTIGVQPWEKGMGSKIEK